MAYCECCGAPLRDGDAFCGECGTIVPKRAAEEFGEQTVRAVPTQTAWDPTAAQPEVKKTEPTAAYGAYAAQQSAWNQPQQPAQPAWNQPQQPAQTPAWQQYMGQPQQQPAFQVPLREQSKGGGVTMIVFGVILLSFLLFTIMGFIISFAEGSASGEPSAIIGAIVGVLVTFGAGGLLLLLFGIRKVKNVKKYNESIRAKLGR